MKANELRIGNWYDDNGVQKQVTPSTIEEVWNAERSWCKPISLTEKWLVKFGIKDLWIKESWKVVEDTSDGETFGWSMFVRNACYTKKIEFVYFKYVHQLQNLYFALTGEELTIGGQDE
jgi:hypothetical protein